LSVYDQPNYLIWQGPQLTSIRKQADSWHLLNDISGFTLGQQTSPMKRSLLLSVILLPLMAAAHPGHGEHGGFTITHYFTELDHAVFTWPVILLTIGLIIRARRARNA
jgi:hypothetical protein